MRSRGEDDLKYCTQCGASHQKQANYCIYDGTPLYNDNPYLPNMNHEAHNTCPYCQTEVRDQALYCYFCGESLEKLTHQNLVKPKDSFSLQSSFNGSFKSLLWKNVIVIALTLIIFSVLIHFIIPKEFIAEENRWNESNYIYLIDNFEVGVKQIEFFKENYLYYHNRENEEDIYFNSFEMLLLSNLSFITLSEDNDYTNMESTVKTNLGITFYFLLVVLSIVGAYLLCYKWFKSLSVKGKLSSSLLFSLSYAIILSIISLTQGNGLEESGNHLSYSYQVSDIFWHALLIGFLSSLCVLLLIDRRKQPTYLNAMKLGLQSYIYLFIAFIAIGIIFYFSLEEYVGSLSSSSNFLNPFVIIVQLAIFIFYISFIVPFSIKWDISGLDYSDSFHYFYHLIISQDITEFNGEDIFNSLSTITVLLWILFAAIIIFLAVRAVKFIDEPIKTRLISISIYSFTFSLIGMILSMSANRVAEQTSIFHDGEAVETMFSSSGFAPLYTLFILFGIVFITTLISSALFKRMKKI